MHTTRLTQNQVIALTTVSAIVVGFLIWFFLIPYKSENMTISSMEWKRVISEKYDWVDCSNQSPPTTNYQGTPQPTATCQKKTIIVNTWTTTGHGANEPYWDSTFNESGVPIGHYVVKSENYWIYFKNDGKLYTYYPFSASTYMRYKPGEQYFATVSRGHIVLKIEPRKPE